MDPDRIRALLESVRDGATSPDEAMQRLAILPFEQLDAASIDHHRMLRRGFPEVVFAQGKTPQQVAAIMERLAAQSGTVLATRAGQDTFDVVRETVPDACY